MTNEAIRVKALEWTEDEPHHDQIDARVFVTVGSLGGYSIHVRTAGAIHSFNDDEMVGMTHDTLEEAKAACQADFARRVGECVEVDDVGNTVALQARCAELEAAAREACEQLKSLAYASHKATGRPLSKRPRTKMLQRPEKVRDNLLAVRKALRSAVDGGE